MTVIAWDGKTLAADRWCVDSVTGLKRLLLGPKIMRVNDEELIAATGSGRAGLLLKGWYRAGADAGAFPRVEQAAETDLYVFRLDRVMVYQNTPEPMLLQPGQHAAGCGGAYALGAMMAGADAVRAVEIACALDVACGGDIDTLTLEG